MEHNSYKYNFTMLVMRAKKNKLELKH